MPDGNLNPNIHAYGHRDLAAEEHLVAVQPEPGVELIILHSEERFSLRHDRVTRRLNIAGSMEMEEKLTDGDVDGELHGDQLLMAQRVAQALPGGAIRISKVIKRIIARKNLERSDLPLAWMPAPPTTQRAKPSGLNAYLRHFAVAWTHPMKMSRSDQRGHLAVRTGSSTTVITSMGRTWIPSQ